MQTITGRRWRSISKGALAAVIISASAMSMAQVGPGGLLFFGDRAIRESIPSSAPIGHVSCNVQGINALRADGSIVAWGDNLDGRLNVPSNLYGVQQTASGSFHTLALLSDGSVAAWGSNNVGQCNVPSNVKNVKAVFAAGNMSFAVLNSGKFVWWGAVPSPQSMDAVGDAVAFSGGDGFVCALRADGTVYCWGASSLGQLNVPASATNIVKVACGANHTVALRADGTVVAWGNNNSGQATVPSNLINVKDIAAGNNHCVALRTDGSLVMWGSNSQHQCTAPAEATDIIDIAAGGAFTAVVKNGGQVFAFGDSSGNQTTVPNFSGVSRFSGLGSNLVGLDEDGHIAYFGKNDNGQSIIPPDLGVAAQVAVGQRHLLAQRSDGVLFAWGDNATSQCNIPNTAGKAKQISAGSFHSVLVGKNGDFIGFGNNQDGQLTAPSGLGTILQVAAGASHTAALKADGTVAVFGDNFYGQRNVPATLSNVVAIAAASNQTLALKSNGTVVGWGWNNTGQVDIPSGLTNVTSITEGDNHSAALRQNGTVAAWGADFANQVSGANGLPDVGQIIATGNTTACLMKMHVVVAPYRVWGGQSAIGTVYLANPAPAGGQSVELSTSDSASLSIPASVVVPEGTRKVDFTVQSINGPIDKQPIIYATMGNLKQRCLFTVLSAAFEVTYNKTAVIGGSTSNVIGTVKLPKPAPQGGTIVSLNSASANLQFPSQVKIGAGKTFANFTVDHLRVNVVSAANLHVTDGTFTDTTPILLQPFAVSSIKVDQTDILAGLAEKVTVKLNASPKADLELVVKSSNGLVIENSAMTVLAGDSSAKGTMATMSVGKMTPVTLSVDLDGSTTNCLVNVYPPIASVGLGRTIYGLQVVPVKVTLSLPSPAGGISILVSGDNLSVPNILYVPEGETTKEFDIVGADVTVKSTGTLNLNCMESITKATRTVFPNTIDTLTLNQPTIGGGVEGPVVGTITLQAAVAVDTVVTLSSSLSSLVSVPATLLIPHGQSSATFPVSVMRSNVKKIVKITATRIGVSRNVTLTVNP